MKAILAFVVALTWSSSALAAPVSLKSDITDADGRVTLGELFEGAGAAADIVVAARSASQTSLVLDAAAVGAIAHRNGLDWANPNGLLRITVRQAIEGADGGVVGAPARTVDVLVYAASLNMGDPITGSGLIWAKLPAAPSGAIADADMLIGKVAKRPLRAGAPALAADGAAPQVIKTGDTVKVDWTNGAVIVSMQGKALSPAAVGQSLSIQNPTSKAMVQAFATGPGAAVTGPGAQTSLAAAQLASR